jgi:hypothetical protein
LTTTNSEPTESNNNGNNNYNVQFNFRQHRGHSHRGHGGNSPCNLAALGKENQVDKFDHTHRYEHLYCDIFAPYHNSHTPSTMLEIGLGCGHPTPSPRSAALWSIFLPSTTYYAIDWIPPTKPLSAPDCLKAMEQATPITAERKIRERVYFGDQANRSFLRETMTTIISQNSSSTASNPASTPQGFFDIIVDDGGHTFEQQRTSFQELWPYLKEGGIYVIEDLQAEHTGMPVVLGKWMMLIAGGQQIATRSKNYGGK